MSNVGKKTNEPTAEAAGPGWDASSLKFDFGRDCRFAAAASPRGSLIALTEGLRNPPELVRVLLETMENRLPPRPAEHLEFIDTFWSMMDLCDCGPLVLRARRALLRLQRGPLSIRDEILESIPDETRRDLVRRLLMAAPEGFDVDGFLKSIPEELFISPAMNTEDWRRFARPAANEAIIDRLRPVRMPPYAMSAREQALVAERLKRGRSTQQPE